MPRWPKKEQDTPTVGEPAAAPSEGAIMTTETAIAEPKATKAPAKDEPFLVKAILTGTYPDPGEVRARFRQVGDVFQVKCQGDFSRYWMERVSAEEAATIVIPSKSIPQTTAKPRKVPAYSTMG